MFADDKFCVFCLENIFILLSFLKYISAGIELLVGSYFLLVF